MIYYNAKTHLSKNLAYFLTEIHGISLDPSSKTEVMQPLGVARNCFAIDFFFNSSLLFYADDRANAIGQVSRVGTAKKSIINSGLRRPQGLAVDWVAGNLFWTDSGNDVIEVCEAQFWYLFPAIKGLVKRGLRGFVADQSLNNIYCVQNKENWKE